MFFILEKEKRQVEKRDERQRETSMLWIGCLPYMPWLGIKPEIWYVPWPEIKPAIFLVHGTTLQPTDPPSQGSTYILNSGNNNVK